MADAASEGPVHHCQWAYLVFAADAVDFAEGHPRSHSACLAAAEHSAPMEGDTASVQAADSEAAETWHSLSSPMVSMAGEVVLALDKATAASVHYSAGEDQPDPTPKNALLLHSQQDSVLD